MKSLADRKSWKDAGDRELYLSIRLKVLNKQMNIIAKQIDEYKKEKELLGANNETR